MCGALALLGAAACQERTSPRLTPLKPSGQKVPANLHRGQVESTAVVIPPGASDACPAGRAVFSYLSYSGQQQHVMSVPLGQLLQGQNEPIDAASPYIDTPLPKGPLDTIPTNGSVTGVQCYGDLGCYGTCGNFTKTHLRYDKTDGDSWMVRIGGGSILYVGMGERYETQTQVPCTGFNAATCDCNVKPRRIAFGALVIFESFDCGKTWYPLSHIDPTDIPDGAYDKFDREAMYYDHFTGNVYITVAAYGGYEATTRWSTAPTTGESAGRTRRTPAPCPTTTRPTT